MQEQAQATEKAWLKIPQVAARMQVSTQTVYSMARDGRLPAYRVGKQWRFDVEEIERHLAQQVAA